MAKRTKPIQRPKLIGGKPSSSVHNGPKRDRNGLTPRLLGMASVPSKHIARPWKGPERKE